MLKTISFAGFIEDSISCKIHQMVVENGAELREGASAVAICDALALFLGPQQGKSSHQRPFNVCWSI